MKVIVDSDKFDVIIKRLAHQLMENHGDFSNTVIIGIQPRGVDLSDRLLVYIESALHGKPLYGKLDITFYRDDFNKGNTLVPDYTDIPFSIENKKVILIDDVLYTGRTIRSALDAILDFGRPSEVELLCLVDRRYSRHVPIQADYTGIMVDALVSEKVIVKWKEKDGIDHVVLMMKK